MEKTKIYRHKIVDWEICQLFRKCYKNYGSRWEAPFRGKMENEFSGKNLSFFVGNMHRFQNQWLIISVFYPPIPKQILEEGSSQQSLF